MKQLCFLCLLLTALSCDWLQDGERAAAPGSEAEAVFDTTGSCTITQARLRVGEKKVCVRGYIVGGDLTQSATGIRLEAPFSVATHLALADSLGIPGKEACLSVQLPAGAVREALNLPDHPEHLGRKVWLKGEVVSAYFGLTGLKNVTDFCWE
ncbi:MAG: hypothetical protein J6X69_07945 [Bacteroidales bacterium]|nr:hypothetical protein [Bacteroidales bacterium]